MDDGQIQQAPEAQVSSVLLLPECTDKTGDAVMLCTGHQACRVLQEAGIPYMVGGGVAVWTYGRRRKTKDMDLFLYPNAPEDAMNALSRAGFHTRETEAGWLYKAIRGNVLIDLIVWTTGHVQVDHEAFAKVRRFEIDGYEFPVMGPEDVLFRKILSHKEERFDWYDALSMMANLAEIDFDWPYFLTRARNFPKRVLSFLLYAEEEAGARMVPQDVFSALLGWTRLCHADGPAGPPDSPIW